MLKQLFVVVIACGLAACASAPTDSDEASGSRGDCIHQPSIRGYRVLDEQNLLVDAARHKSYHVTLKRRAFGLRSSWAIAFDSPTTRICEGFSEVVFRDQMGPERIRIASIRELTPEEEEGLLIRFGKKEPEIEQTPVPQDVKGADVEELDPDDGQ